MTVATTVRLLFMSAALILLLAVLFWSGVMVSPLPRLTAVVFAIAAVVQLILALELRGVIAGIFFKKDNP